MVQPPKDEETLVMRFGVRPRTDPWWDLEGARARRDRRIHQLVSALAFILSVTATGLTAAVWFRLLEPYIPRLLG